MSLKVMVIDSDEELCDLLSFSLNKAGMVTYVTGENAELHDVIESFDPELIVIDRHLITAITDQNFFDHPEIPEIPMALILKKSDLTGTAVGSGSPSPGFIRKPFTPRNLITQIKSLVA